jgi:hypothetical protein
MSRKVLWLHIVSVVAAYALVAIWYTALPATTNSEPQRTAATQVVAILAATGSLTGLGLMARRSGATESIALAVSTIAAVLLLILAL